MKASVCQTRVSKNLVDSMEPSAGLVMERRASQVWPASSLNQFDCLAIVIFFPTSTRICIELVQCCRRWPKFLHRASSSCAHVPHIAEVHEILNLLPIRVAR